MALFEFPKSAVFGRVLPKSKIYEHSRPNSKIKELFVKQVERIVWAYKLSSETINLASSPFAPEIQIFRIDLKNGEIHEDVLRCIDKAIPFPLIFDLHYNNKQKLIAAFKRPSVNKNNAENNKWILESYFESDWVSKDAAKKLLPQSVDLKNLYEQILKSLMPLEMISVEANQTLEQQVAKIDQIKVLQKEIVRLEMKFNKEKQPNRQFDINKQLKHKKLELDNLINR